MSYRFAFMLLVKASIAQTRSFYHLSYLDSSRIFDERSLHWSHSPVVHAPETGSAQLSLAFSFPILVNGRFSRVSQKRGSGAYAADARYLGSPQLRLKQRQLMTVSSNGNRARLDSSQITYCYKKIGWNFLSMISARMQEGS